MATDNDQLTDLQGEVATLVTQLTGKGNEMVGLVPAGSPGADVLHAAVSQLQAAGDAILAAGGHVLDAIAAAEQARQDRERAEAEAAADQAAADEASAQPHPMLAAIENEPGLGGEASPSAAS